MSRTCLLSEQAVPTTACTMQTVACELSFIDHTARLVSTWAKSGSAGACAHLFGLVISFSCCEGGPHHARKALRDRVSSISTLDILQI